MRCSRQACCVRVDIDAGELNEANGRWTVEFDADGAVGTAVPCHISVRPVNLVEREVSGYGILELQKPVSLLKQQLREPKVAMTESKISAQEQMMEVLQLQAQVQQMQQQQLQEKLQREYQELELLQQQHTLQMRQLTQRHEQETQDLEQLIQQQPPPVNLVEREVSGGRRSFCNAPLPLLACTGTHCVRIEACATCRLQPMMLLTRITSDLGPSSSAALPAIVLQP